MRVEIKGLLDRAERDDADAGSEPQGLPEELKLKAKLDKARAEPSGEGACGLEEYSREQREGSRKGKPIKAPAPRDEEQVNLTDPTDAH